MTEKLRNESVTALHALLAIAASAAPLALGGCTMETDAGVPEGEPTAGETQALRREDFGQSRSLAVTDQGNVYRGDLPLWPRWSTTFAPSIVGGAFRSDGVTSIRRVSWVGDRNSYVDVFTNDLGAATSAGTFRRYQFPYASGQQRAFYSFPTGGFTFTPAAYSFDLPTTSTWRSVRVYDRGECSAEATYRELGDGIVSGLTTKLDEQFRDSGLGGASLREPSRVRPLLSAAAGGISTDRFEIATKYRIATCSGDLDLTIQGRFVRSGNAPSFSISSVNAHMDFGNDACAGFLTFGGSLAGKFDHWFNVGGLQDEIETKVTDAIRAELPGAIRKAIAERMAADPGVSLPCTVGERGDDTCLSAMQAGLRARGDTALADALGPTNARCVATPPSTTRGTCKVVPNVLRVNTRADGIELVLADERTDPWYPSLNGAGVCGRAEPASLPPMSFSWPTPPAPAQSTFGTITL